MSLPEFKFTNLTKPTNNTAVNSGLSSKDKMVKSGIIPNVIEKVPGFGYVVIRVVRYN
jgi:hypothetical protein